MIDLNKSPKKLVSDLYHFLPSHKIRNNIPIQSIMNNETWGCVGSLWFGVSGKLMTFKFR